MAVGKEGSMELPNASYFYTMAQVGITFSGFSALLLAVQQMRGMPLTNFQKYAARIYVMSGMLTTANAMLSPLLFGLGLTEEMTWRVASGLIATASFYRLSVLPRQWRAATSLPYPMRVKVQVVLTLFLNTGLLLNAAGWPFAPSGGFVMFAVSWALFSFFVQFSESFRFVFEEEGDINT
jgi:hypothetical protein